MSDSKPVPAALEHLAARLQDVSDAWWKEHNPTAPRPTVHFEIPPMSPYADPTSQRVFRREGPEERDGVPVDFGEAVRVDLSLTAYNEILAAERAKGAAEARKAIAHLFDEAEPICTGCDAVTPPCALTLLHGGGCPIVAAAATDVGQELLEKAQRVFDKAVAEEREACALVALGFGPSDGFRTHEKIATAIRARGAR